jgi:hypothetical protein
VRGATGEAHLNYATGRPCAGQCELDRAVRPDEIERGRDTERCRESSASSQRRAEVLFARNALVAESVAPSTVDRDVVSFFHRTDTRTNAIDRTGILMAKRERHPRKDLDVTRNDVEIAMTETSALDSNHDLPWTRRRAGHVVNDERLPRMREVVRLA